MTIYDQINQLPRTHRLALAGWILRTTPAPQREWQRLLGISRQAIDKKAKA